MVEFASLPQRVEAKHIAVYAAIVAVGGAIGGYSIHEHHVAQNLAAKNEAMVASLSATEHELGDLRAKVDSLAARSQTLPAPTAQSRQSVTGRPSAAHLLKEAPR
jgi:hypothetical protein